MKKIISVIAMAGAFVQMSNAMGPIGDTTHRHFYKDQEWIWQREQSQKFAPSGGTAQKGDTIHVWQVPATRAVQVHPPLAFVLPTHPPLAFVVPSHPPLAFVVPSHPPLAFVVPSHPSQASL